MNIPNDFLLSNEGFCDDLYILRIPNCTPLRMIHIENDSDGFDKNIGDAIACMILFVVSYMILFVVMYDIACSSYMILLVVVI